MTKLALNMIVKDDSEFELLQRCLNSIAKYVDGIFVTATNEPYEKVKTLIESYGGEVSFFKWTKSFEEARNYALTQVPKEYDYIVWTDADDVWRGAEKIPDMVKLMEAQGVTGVFFDYNYQINPKTGEVEIVHPRERIVKRGYYEWKGHLHETMISTREVNNAYFKDIVVDHLPPKSATEANLWRNLEILEQTYEREGEKHDPRTEYYLARNYFDVEKYDEALKLFNDYVQHSGWDEERAQAYNYMGLIYVGKQDFEMGKRLFLTAISEDPDVPTWYINLAYLYVLQEKWEEATHYARLFVNTPMPKSAMVQIPIDNKIKYYDVIARIAYGKRKTKEAIDALKELVKLAPHVKDFQDRLKGTQRLEELVETTKSVETIIKELDKNGEKQLIPTLLNGLPSTIQDNAYIEQLRIKHVPPKEWPEKSIVYYTGRSFEEWTPDSLKTGVGGSETAVIHLAKNWVKQGYKVTVYGNCGTKEGVFDGVEYKNYYRFNRRDTFDTLVIWRAPWELEFNWKANRVWLDLHDVPNPREFSEDRLEKVDKIFVKSDYHRSLLPNVPDEKFVIVPNGVDGKLEKLDKNKHKPHKLIYASSYDRGLEHMLRWGWPIIKKEIPQATLDIYYGWNLFDAVHKNNPERKKWKAEMLELMSQKGVKEHGRVGHEELLKEKAKSIIHYYATDFEEIDCISVRESALVGCVPVTTDYAALEGRAYCLTHEGDPKLQETHENIAKNIVKHLKDKDLGKTRVKFKELAREETWDKIAAQWLKNV